MDGDGSGKGSHLSFFLTVMCGEFDSLLQWPLTVSMILLDQEQQIGVIQTFTLSPVSGYTSIHFLAMVYILPTHAYAYIHVLYTIISSTGHGKGIITVIYVVFIIILDLQDYRSQGICMYVHL